MYYATVWSFIVFLNQAILIVLHLELNSRNLRASWEELSLVFFGCSLGLQSYIGFLFDCFRLKTSSLAQAQYLLLFRLLIAMIAALQDIIHFFFVSSYICVCWVLCFFASPFGMQWLTSIPKFLYGWEITFMETSNALSKYLDRKGLLGRGRMFHDLFLPLSKKWRLDMKKLSLILAMLDFNRMLRCFILSFSTWFCYLVDILIENITLFKFLSTKIVTILINSFGLTFTFGVLIGYWYMGWSWLWIKWCRERISWQNNQPKVASWFLGRTSR